MGLLRRRSSRTSADADVPGPLSAPRNALVRPLRFAVDSRVYDGTMDVEVLPFGAPPRERTLRSATRPSSFVGMVVGSYYPAVVDDDDPATVLLVEPPCGHRLPVPDPEFEALWPARDERARRLRAACPAPSPEALEALLVGTDDAPADPTLASVLTRFRLLTTDEALAVNDRIRADGMRWEQAVARFDVAKPLDFDGATEAADALSHLGDVAGRPPVDPHPLMSIGMTVRWRHLVRDPSDGDVDADGQPSPDDLRVVVAPFAELCGPISL